MIETLRHSRPRSGSGASSSGNRIPASAGMTGQPLTWQVPFLAAGEAFYAGAVRAAHWAYRVGILKTHRLPAPVVSVGNLTWGGTGKTPLVLHLARALEGKGYRVAVLTRGYGGDEPRMLEARLNPIPVLVDPDRVASGMKAAKQMGKNLLLLDDGFQQWRLKKDVEILTADAAAPFGNGHLIPRGTLREPPSCATRADLIVLKAFGEDHAERARAEELIRRHNRRAPIFWMKVEPARLWRWPSRQEMPLQSLRRQGVCTLAGIADPRPFEKMVESLGAVPQIKIRVGDHHAYTVGELVRVLERCRRHGLRGVVTTEKDAARIPELLARTVGNDLKGVELAVLEIRPRFEPDEAELLHRIHTLLAG